MFLSNQQIIQSTKCQKLLKTALNSIQDIKFINRDKQQILIFDKLEEYFAFLLDSFFNLVNSYSVYAEQ